MAFVIRFMESTEWLLYLKALHSIFRINIVVPNFLLFTYVTIITLWIEPSAQIGSKKVFVENILK